MDSLFLVMGTLVCAVEAAVFFFYRRRYAAWSGDGGEAAGDTLRLHILVLVFFVESTVLNFSRAEYLPGRPGYVSALGLIFLVDLIPMIYLRRIKYVSSFTSRFRWMLPAVTLVVYSVPVLSYTDIGEAAVCLMRVSFLLYNLYQCHVTALAQCRLFCRLGRESISGHLMKSTAVFLLMILLLLIFSALTASGGDSCLVTFPATAVTFFLMSCHSVQVLGDYPLLKSMERNCRRFVKKEDAAGHASDVWTASDSLTARLTEYFEVEKPYRSPDLCINEVAMRLLTNKTTLSKAIHSKLNTNFREYVNRYRVKEAMSLYSSNMHLDMERLAKLSGFRNNSSFTNAFKLNVGMTPWAWCRDFKEKRNEIWQKEVLESVDGHAASKKEALHDSQDISGEDKPD